jgi:hypothetical protein
MATAPTEIVLRPAYADDELALIRLAALDSADGVPPAPLLIAELDGELRVALSLRDGSVIADPFTPTAGVIELLRLHAARRQRAGGGAALRPRLRAPSRPWSRAPRFSAP